MKKQENETLANICDGIEYFFQSLNKKDREKMGVTICSFVATFATSSDDPFAPFGILEKSRIELSNILDKEFLDIVNEEVGKHAKKMQKSNK